MALRSRKARREYGLEDQIDFGKHRGTKIRVLIENELSYMAFMVDSGFLILDKTAMNRFSELGELDYDQDSFGGGFEDTHG